MWVGWSVGDGLRFRAGKLGVIPYIVESFPVSAIAEVMIGPGAHAAIREEAIRQLLERYEYEDVTVTRSLSTLR